LNFLNKIFKPHTYPRNMASVQAWKLFLCLLLPLSGRMFLTFTFLTEKTRDILPIKHYIALCFNTAIFKRLNINLWNFKKKSYSYQLSRFILDAFLLFLLFFNFALDWFSFQHLILKLWGCEIRKLLLFIKKKITFETSFIPSRCRLHAINFMNSI